MAATIYPRPMIVAAAQHVSVDRDPMDWFFDILGAIGGLTGAIALWYAAQAKRDVAEERRRLFELDVLRELAAGIDNGFLYRISDDPERLRQFARRLDLLPGQDLPFWREMMDSRYLADFTGGPTFIAQQMARSKVVADIASRQPGVDAAAVEQARWQEERDAAVQHLQRSAHDFRESVSQRLMDDLVHAITTRVEDGGKRVAKGPLGRLRRWWRFGV
jgi:hypothetical protein